MIEEEALHCCPHAQKAFQLIISSINIYEISGLQSLCVGLLILRHSFEGLLIDYAA